MSKTLLLADDSVVIQKLVGLSFANEDVELTTTDNGDDAIAKARELKPDLVLADVVMPGKNGYEVCEALKADPQMQHIPVLLLTGTFEAFDENRARSAGSDGHITKPFEAQALVDRVTELLARAPAQPPLATTAPNLDGPAVTRIAAVPPAEGDDAFEFFDDGVSDLSDAVAAPPAAPATPSPLEQPAPAIARPPAAQPPAPLQQPTPGVAKPAGSALPPLSQSEAADDPLMPDVAPASTPPIDDLAFDAEDVSATLEADEDSMPLDAGATTVQLNDDTDTPAPGAADDDLLLGDAPSWNDDLEINPEPIRAPADDATQLADDLFQDPPARPPVDLDAAMASEAKATPADSGSTLMSDGARSSDSIAFGKAAAPAAPDPMKTMLADDLFGDAEPPSPPPLPTGSHEPTDLDIEAAAGPGTPGPSAVDDFDVSSSDLEQSIPAMPPLDETATADAPVATTKMDDAAEVSDEDDDFSVSDGLLAGAPSAQPTEAPAATPVAASPVMAPTDMGPDLTPMMRERVHETLERVAWEAFADLSDTIVKQVVEKVEQVAWEVIPQMAEAAIKEEIRRMKGDNDE